MKAWTGPALLAVSLCGACAGAPPPAGTAVPAATLVAVERQADGTWIADYRFARPAAAWFFPRSNPDYDGKPWRQQAWTVETPGVRLLRPGKYDVLTADGAPIGRVRIRFRPFGVPLRADYTPALIFSDGGLALYTDQFLVSPTASLAAAAALPADLADTAAETPTAVTVSDPGRRLLVRGRVTAGTVVLKPGETATYVYSGDAPIIENAAFAGVLDPGLPGWVRTELTDFTPGLMQLYTRRLGKPAGGRPMALISWGGAARPGWSNSGSVLDGMVVMDISGRMVLEGSPPVLTGLRWFIGHESAHFWVGHTIAYTRPSEAWITEGSADLLAIRALQQLASGYDALPELQREMDGCLKLNGAGKPLFAAGERGDNKAYYHCGALLLLAAEAAAGKKTPDADAFTFVRRLIDVHRRVGKVGQADWLAAFRDVTGSDVQTEAVRTYIEKGVGDPKAFFASLFAATGVRFDETAETLKLR